MREVAAKSSYRGVTVGNLMANELSTRAGQRRTMENLVLDQAGVTKKVFEELKKYAESLSSNLFANVYNEEDTKLINTVRVLLDFETLAIKLKLSGHHCSPKVSLKKQELLLLNCQRILIKN
jgi:hypothetical protein